LALALDSAQLNRIAIDEDKKWEALQSVADEIRFKLKQAMGHWEGTFKALGGRN
jgi:hypothetical protein